MGLSYNSKQDSFIALHVISLKASEPVMNMSLYLYTYDALFVSRRFRYGQLIRGTRIHDRVL